MSSRAPVIGISGGSSDSASVRAVVTQIRSTGAEPVFLGGHQERIGRHGSADAAVKHDLSRLDSLVVMGNNDDIDPAKYGQDRDPATKVETDLARAAYEEKAIQYALDSGMPLMGVCGGMQRLNVLGGGTLLQDITRIVGDNHHMQTDAPFVPVQIVSIEQDTRLGNIAGNKGFYTPTHQQLPPGMVPENSMHHQAVDKVRGDFRVNAVSDDGIIEGIEPTPGSRYANQFVLGVQWHPEFGASELGPKIAGNLTHAAQAFAESKARDARATGGDRI
jgi:putative glutamine amidotransferase